MTAAVEAPCMGIMDGDRSAGADAGTGTWWGSSGWFSGGIVPVEMDVSTAKGPDGAKVGGAQSQNRFAGNTHVPVNTTAPVDGSPLLPGATTVPVKSGPMSYLTAHGPPIGGAVAHSRFNDRKKPAGKTLDGSIRAPGSSRASSSWRFDVGAWQWEHNDGSGQGCAEQLAPLQRRTGGGSGNRVDDLTKAMVKSRLEGSAGGDAAGKRKRDGPGGSERVQVTRSAPTKALTGVGGLDSEARDLRELMELRSRMPRLVRHLGVKLPSGVLLHGPPGTGKTLLARALAEDLGMHLEVVNGPEMVAGDSGPKDLQQVFASAQHNAPSVLLLDEVDSMAPSREKTSSEHERRCTTQLLTLMDGLVRSGKHVVVVATTSRPNAVDGALRRAGRLDKEIELGAPSRKGRLGILEALTASVPLQDDVSLERIAAETHGYVGADLAEVVSEAALACIRELVEDGEAAGLFSDEALEDHVMERAQVGHAHFSRAIEGVPPSALRELATEVPETRWEDIGGLEHVKRALVEQVTYPVLHADKYAAYGITPGRGALLYGPPGCGKTLLAKAVASECQANFISIKGPELLDKWLGESERGIRELFGKARASAPCVVFFDEIDSVAPRRGNGASRAAGDEAAARVLTQLLTELDGMGARKDVFVIGATNRPEALDPAVIRPGRMDEMHLVGLPDEASRLGVLRAALRRAPLAAGVDLPALAAATEGFSGADLAAVCKRAVQRRVAAEIAREEAAAAAAAAGPEEGEEDVLRVEDVEWAMAGMRRSVSEAEAARFDEIREAIREGRIDALAAEADEDEATAAGGAGGGVEGGDGATAAQRQLISQIIAQSQEVGSQPGAEGGLLAKRVEVLEAALRAAGVAVPSWDVVV